MSKNLYMHTINGHPAMYQDGTYICYVTSYMMLNFDDMFVGSLKAIRRQQKWSRQYHEQQGDTNFEARQYGYIRIKDNR